MKVYIAGKITGDPFYKSKFRRYEEILQQSGHVVLNPANLPEGLKPEEYMRICFAMIDMAAAVCFLPGYEESKGALLEFQYCRYIGKPVGIFGADGIFRPTIAI